MIILKLPTSIAAAADTITTTTDPTVTAIMTTMNMMRTAPAAMTMNTKVIAPVAAVTTITATAVVPAAMTMAVVAVATTIATRKGIYGSSWPVRSSSSWAC